jgi:hypothetical protein
VHNVTSEAAKQDKAVPMSLVTEGVAKVLGYTVIYEKKFPIRAVFYCEDLKLERKVLSSTNDQVIQSCMEGEWVHKELNFKNNSVV